MHGAATSHAVRLRDGRDLVRAVAEGPRTPPMCGMPASAISRDFRRRRLRLESLSLAATAEGRRATRRPSPDPRLKSPCRVTTLTTPAAVQVPDDDRVASGVANVFEHASVGRTLLPAVGTDVVVNVLCGDGLSSAPCFLAAVHQLTQDAKAVAITVL